VGDGGKLPVVTPPPDPSTNKAPYVYYASKDEWKLSMIFYALAFMGDVADGFVARAFNQCKS
jgi:hypothetical protein